MKTAETPDSLDAAGATPRKTLAAKASLDATAVSPEKKSNAIRNSLLAGSAAGITSTIACHPFDVLRVKMQSSAPLAMATSSSTAATTTGPLGLAGTIRSTIQFGGGFRALYTGLAMPLAAQAVYKGTIFTVNNMTESFIKDWKTRSNQRQDGSFGAPYKLTLSDRFICGFMGGAANAALFCTPVEYVRNQQIAQIETASTQNNLKGSICNKSRVFTGPLAVIRTTIQSHGVTGLWRGMTSTILRDSVGCGFFFVAMAYSQERLSSPGTQPPSTPVVIISGALAGVSFWLWALPVDTLKTWIQNGTASNMSHAVLKMSQHRDGIWQSLPSLFRGWQVAYSRGAPSAAITVVTYSLASQYLQGVP